MSRKYANPPIIEAVCEFQLSPDTEWDPTVAGLLYERLKEEFPRKDRRPVKQVSTNAEGEELEQSPVGEDRALFFAADDRSFVQVGTRLLTVNCLGPYPSWQVFQPKISRALEALEGTVEIKGFQTISLRYVDLIEIPGKKIELDKYFDFSPALGDNLPKEVAAFFLGCLLSFAEGRDACRIELTNAVAEKKEHSAFRLTTDYFLDGPSTLEPSEALKWVEDAHEQVRRIFEGCIKDSLRQLLDGTE